MAGSVNKVILVGNLGQDPEVRYTTNQTPVATLNIATTDYRQGADGQKQEQTEWHRVIVWSKMAELCQRYLSKGRSVYVEGRLQTRSWEDKASGQKRYTTEIVAQNIQFLDKAGGASRENASPYSQQGQPQQSYGNQPPQQEAPSGGSNQFDMNFDDIPF